MSNVVESIPEQFRSLFVEVLAERDASLLAGLQNQAEPTPEQREAVDDIFSSEIVRELGPDYEASERGQQLKRAIEEFWYRWPNE